MNTVANLRELLYNTMKQTRFMMDKGIIYRDVRKYMAIEKLRIQFDAIAHTSLHVHYRWLMKLRTYVIDIMPPSAGRYKEQRVKLIQLLDEAEKTLNYDAMRVRVL